MATSLIPRYIWYTTIGVRRQAVEYAYTKRKNQAVPVFKIAANAVQRSNQSSIYLYPF
jgi:hypothetical protein